MIGVAGAGDAPPPLGEESAVIGTVQAFGLACGFLFLSLYGGVLADLENLLFGDFLGITRGEVLTLAIVSRARARLLRAGRAGRCCSPRSTSRSRAPAACPSAVVDSAFLLALGLAVAATAQITGVLLVFALLVAPAGDGAADHAAHRRSASS